MATWAVSDLHGQYELFLAILDAIDPDDTVYYLGDACDRGHDGFDLMKSIWFQPNWIYLKGNHEVMFEEATTEYIKRGDWEYSTYSLCIQNGGYETLFCWELESDTYRKIWRNRIARLPMFAEYTNPSGQRILLSHSGFTPVLNRHTKEVSVDPENEYRLCWDRDHMYTRWNPLLGEVYVVHGHTPIQYYGDGYDVEHGPLVYAKKHKIDIDCESSKTNAAFVLNLDTFEYITVTVEGEDNGENAA